jgi:metal-responsive CopG/Arc/MetJ family transcriptional regulator
MAEKEMIRLSVDVSPELYEIIDKIAQETHTSKSELFRKAIALINVAFEAKRQGERLGIVDQDRKLVQEIVGLL